MHFKIQKINRIPSTFKPVCHFYTPWKRQNTSGFQTFSGGREMKHWLLTNKVKSDIAIKQQNNYCVNTIRKSYHQLPSCQHHSFPLLARHYYLLLESVVSGPKTYHNLLKFCWRKRNCRHTWNKTYFISQINANIQFNQEMYMEMFYKNVPQK